MATRSMIGIDLKNGTVKAIYAHWDGYPEHNGAILLGHYTDTSKIELLLNEGNVSVLGKEIGVKHTFDDGMPGCCTFYIRDRGDLASRNKALILPLETFQNAQEYSYLWDTSTSTWSVSDNGQSFEPLAQVVAKLVTDL